MKYGPMQITDQDSHDNDVMLCAAAIGKTVEKETIKMFRSDHGMEFWKDFQKDRDHSMKGQECNIEFYLCL